MHLAFRFPENMRAPRQNTRYNSDGQPEKELKNQGRCGDPNTASAFSSQKTFLCNNTEKKMKKKILLQRTYMRCEALSVEGQMCHHFLDKAWYVVGTLLMFVALLLKSEQER